MLKFRLKSDNIRTNALIQNTIWSFGIRGVSIIISLVQLPLTLSYVNRELYGIWITLSSIVSWLAFFDIGFGNGLRNKLATSLALDEKDKGRKYVSTTYAILSLIFIPLSIVCYVATAYIDWCSLLSVNPIHQQTLISVSRIIIVTFCLNNILKLISNVYQAYQKTAMASAITTLGNLVSLFFVFILVKTTEPNLNYLALVFCCVPMMVLILSSVYMYTHRFRDVAPSFLQVRFEYGKDLFNLGSQFFLIQIICLLLYQATNFIISHFCGPEQVTIYSIAYTYLNVAQMAFTIILTPIWSGYSDAFARKDYQWMSNIYSKLLRVVGFTLIGVICLVVISPIVYKIWLNGRVEIPFAITGMIALYQMLLAVSNLHANLLNGMGKVRLQIYQAFLQGIIYIPLVYILAPRYGVYGVSASLIASALIPTIILPIQVNKLLRKTASGIWNK